ncbi:MAG: RidA family protein, partial [Saprospiraceae bacterium]|nr:RidA family protein [Saprospiraceae bacterium]
VGYSRAIRIGNRLEISGTTAVDDSGAIIGVGNPYQQTLFILQKIENVMKEAGFALDTVVRTRMYVADITQWEEIGRAHGEFFAVIKPVTTMVQVARLIDRDMLVEIEISAELYDI